MSEPIYKFWKIRQTEAWYRLNEEEKRSKIALIEGARERVGNKTIFAADCRWSTDTWSHFGIDQYPSLESVKEFTSLLQDMDLFRYIDSSVILGTMTSFEHSAISI